MTNPTEFFYDESISDEFCGSVLEILNQDNSANYNTIRSILTNFIKKQKTFKNLQYFSVAKEIADAFGVGYEVIEQLIEIISMFFEERQDLYDKIAGTVIPVIVYTDDESNLPEILIELILKVLHLIGMKFMLLKRANAKQDYNDLADEIDRLREMKQNAMVENAGREGLKQRIAEMKQFLAEQTERIEEYDESFVRRMVERITVYEDKFTVEFKSGTSVDVDR